MTICACVTFLQSRGCNVTAGCIWSRHAVRVSSAAA